MSQGVFIDPNRRGLRPKWIRARWLQQEEIINPLRGLKMSEDECYNNMTSTRSESKTS